jgi:hypothetical protein
LRAAIIAANTSPGPDAITFSIERHAVVCSSRGKDHRDHW